MAPLKVSSCYTPKTKGAFEGAEGAIQCPWHPQKAWDECMGN